MAMREINCHAFAAFAVVIVFWSLVNCNQSTTGKLLAAKGINARISLSFGEILTN